MGFDLIAQDEASAGVAGSGLGELVAESGQSLGAPWGGERVEADEQFALARDDVTRCGEGFADERVGLVAGTGVVGAECARTHFALDALDSYAAAPDNPDRLVPNPAKKAAAAQVRSAEALAAAAEAQRDASLAALKFPAPATLEDPGRSAG